MKKLRSKAGETLTETLVALLIGTLALAMLASMIGSTSKILQKTQGILTDYYASAAQLASHKKTDDSVSVSAGKVTINSSDFILFGNTEKTPVTYYSTTAADTTVTSYERGAE